jgi:hypothetical protein
MKPRRKPEILEGGEVGVELRFVTEVPDPAPGRFGVPRIEPPDPDAAGMGPE